MATKLFPPIVDTYMPSFVNTETCRVYFSISPFNNINDIKYAQVSVNFQKNNKTALDKTLYPASIKITQVWEDLTRTTDDKYYIIITPKDLQTKAFQINQFYKIQIRFTDTTATASLEGTNQALWINQYLNNTSEWSSVCLIKGISEPNFEIRNLGTNLSYSSGATIPQTFVAVGSLRFPTANGQNSQETETLKSVHIIAYNNKEIFADSGTIFTNEYNPNEFQYTFKKTFLLGESYTFEVDYKTINGYKQHLTFYATVGRVSGPILQEQISKVKVKADNEFGVVNIDFSYQFKASGASKVDLILLRSSSEDNFAIWEDINIMPIKKMLPVRTLYPRYEFIDHTAKSGVLYKYGVQFYDANKKTRTNRTDLNAKPIMQELEYSALVKHGIQFNLRADENVNGYSTVIQESKTETIGSKYPFIRRNGSVNYKQFNISGLITTFDDFQSLLLPVIDSRAEKITEGYYEELSPKYFNRGILYGENAHYYEEYNAENNITFNNDFTYERDYREKILDFLREDNLTLFKSAAEGNVLVRLMAISLDPKEGTNRLVYSFSATAVEVDACSIENFDKYKIQTIGKLSDIDRTYDMSQQKQLNTMWLKGEDLLKLTAGRVIAQNKITFLNPPPSSLKEGYQMLGGTTIWYGTDGKEVTYDSPKDNMVDVHIVREIAKQSSTYKIYMGNTYTIGEDVEEIYLYNTTEEAIRFTQSGTKADGTNDYSYIRSDRLQITGGYIEGASLLEAIKIYVSQVRENAELASINKVTFSGLNEGDTISYVSALDTTKTIETKVEKDQNELIIDSVLIELVAATALPATTKMEVECDLEIRR